MCVRAARIGRAKSDEFATWRSQRLDPARRAFTAASTAAGFCNGTSVRHVAIFHVAQRLLLALDDERFEFALAFERRERPHLLQEPLRD